MFRQLSKKAQSTIEYVTLLIVLMGALLIFGKYLQQAFQGRWRATGETFGEGMQFEATNTLQCRFDTFTNSGCWYNIACFDAKCDCRASVMAINILPCRSCIISCERCNDNMMLCGP